VPGPFLGLGANVPLDKPLKYHADLLVMIAGGGGTSK